VDLVITTQLDALIATLAEIETLHPAPGVPNT
jgi:hypothetical protein